MSEHSYQGATSCSHERKNAVIVKKKSCDHLMCCSTYLDVQLVADKALVLGGAAEGQRARVQHVRQVVVVVDVLNHLQVLLNRVRIWKSNK